MRTLYISGRKAVIKKDTTINLIRVNPFADAQGDYTFDIELPLHGCPQNVAIFGAAHRAEIPKMAYVGRRYPAQLIAPPVALRGHVTVTQVTDALIKAQFLSGYSDLANAFTDEDGKDIYIDQLDGLGLAWDNHPKKTDEESVEEYLLKKYAGTRGETSCVAFPIYGLKTDGKTKQIMNSLIDTKTNPNGCWTAGEDNVIVGSGLETVLPKYTYRDSECAPQPYLTFVIERIINALGFELGTNELAGTWLENIFIANPRPQQEIKKMLPHLTLKDFFEEIAQFLGVYFDVIDGKVCIIKNKVSSKTETIRNVLAAFTDDIEEETKGKTAQTGNVGYDYKEELPKKLVLPEEVFEEAVIKKDGEYIKGKEAAVSKDKKNLLVIEGAKYTAALTNTIYTPAKIEFAEVNQMGALIRDWSSLKADVKLKVVPVRNIGATFYYRYTDPSNGHEVSNHEDYPALYAPVKIYQEATYDIEKAITDGNAGKAEYVERLYVALNTGDKYYFHNAKATKFLPAAIGINYTTNKHVYINGGIKNPPDYFCYFLWEFHEMKHCPFCLRETRSPSIAADAWQGIDIKTAVEHVVQFADRAAALEPTATYIIHGRRYVCHKLELEITDRGLKQLKTGYFYELNNN